MKPTSSPIAVCDTKIGSCTEGGAPEEKCKAGPRPEKDTETCSPSNSDEPTADGGVELDNSPRALGEKCTMDEDDASSEQAQIANIILQLSQQPVKKRKTKPGHHEGVMSHVGTGDRLPMSPAMLPCPPPSTPKTPHTPQSRQLGNFPEPASNGHRGFGRDSQSPHVRGYGSPAHSKAGEGQGHMSSLSLDSPMDEMRANPMLSETNVQGESPGTQGQSGDRSDLSASSPGMQCGRVPSASDSGAMHSSNSKATEARRPYRCSKCGAEKKGHLCSAKVTVNSAPPPPVPRLAPSS
mmetsp:Transcript_9392/g.31426  ORF Transcript_9392/g.31426 Transcript_9392/m.31426 type:complete len:295 (-) Transcript_9392:357-1241(-)